ncbi:MAG TPA: STAS domain-containing protein [Ilumatobacteraceae bacterium]|jgi:anti-sigma B factor antagonist|nr:STAS domain-containing protein [Ilumatobacteraceae bacterium]
MSDMGSQLEISANDDGWTLSGEIDAHTAPTLAAAMLDLPSGVVRIDMADVSFMDSSGLRVLMEATARARDGGGDLVVARPSAPVARLVEISGLGEQLRIDG